MTAIPMATDATQSKEQLMDEMVELAERCEKATADEQGALLRQAFEAIHGPKPVRIHGGSPELDAWFKLFEPFYKLTTGGGFLDAAMTLVPEGWGYNVNVRSKPEGLLKPSAQCWMHPHGTKHAEAATPALALCAAALRAQATSRGGEG